MAAAWAWKPLPIEQAELLNAKVGYSGKWNDVPMFVGTDGTNEVISLCFDGFNQDAFAAALVELGLSAKAPRSGTHAIAQELTVYELLHNEKRLGLLILNRGTAGNAKGMATLGYMSEACAIREGLLDRAVDAHVVAVRLFSELLAEVPRCQQGEGPAERSARHKGWISVKDPMTSNTYALERDGHRFVIGDNDSPEMFTVSLLEGYDSDKMQDALRAEYSISGGREKRLPRGTLMILKLAGDAGFVAVTQVSELSPVGGGTISFISLRAGLEAGVW